MTTKTLKRLKKQSNSKPAAIALKLRKKSMYVLIFYSLPATAAIGMIIAKFWVPGLAWLE